MYFFGYLLNMSDDLPYYLVKYGILKQSIPFLSNILSDKKRGTKRNVIKHEMPYGFKMLDSDTVPGINTCIGG